MFMKDFDVHVMKLVYMYIYECEVIYGEEDVYQG